MSVSENLKKYREQQQKELEEAEKESTFEYEDTTDDVSTSDTDHDQRKVDIIDRAMNTFIEKKKNGKNPISIFADSLLDTRFREELPEIAESLDSGDKAIVCAIITEIMESEDPRFNQETRLELNDLADLLKTDSLYQIIRHIRGNFRTDKSLISDVLKIIPSPDVVDQESNIIELTQEMNKKIYSKVEIEGKDISPEFVQKLYEIFFGYKGLKKVALGILLEKRDMYFEFKSEQSRTIWNAITEMALEILDGVESDSYLTSLLRIYISKRKYDKTDTPRRYNLIEVDSSEFRRLNGAVRRLVSENKNNEKFLQD